MDKLFMGKNGFFWGWGTVEDNVDPLGLGRCRVRVVGIHNQDDTKIPIEALPWATVLLPTTEAGVSGIGSSPVGLKVGSRVAVFFMDGALAQQPVIWGVVGGEALNENAIASPGGSLSYPNALDRNISGDANIVCREGDCPSPEELPHVSAETEKLYSLDVLKSEWGIPFTGFVSSPYGPRGRSTHKGVDICPAGFYKQTQPGAKHLRGRCVGPVGLPVYAAADGTVIRVWRADQAHGKSSRYDISGPPQPRSYGNAIQVQHTLSTGTYTTIYAHLGISQDPAQDQPLAGINVQVGDKVKKGQVIGTVGRSHVRDVLTHLHFEIRLGPGWGNPINPGRIFPQLLNVHSAFKSWPYRQANYDVEPHSSPNNAPVKAKTGPSA